MAIPIFLAHGALGNFDEVVFIGVAVIFLTMMGISWVRSRNMQVDEPPEEPAQPTAEPNAPDRFKLD